MSTDLFAELQGLDQQQGEPDAEYRLRLKNGLDTEQTKTDGPQLQANLFRLKLGLSLLAARPPSGVLKWQRDRAKELGYEGKNTRAIRELIAVADAVQAAKTDSNGLARIVPIDIIQCAWAQVRRAVKTFAVTGVVGGKIPRTPLSTQDQATRAMAALEKAMARAAALVSAAELQAWLAGKQGAPAVAATKVQSWDLATDPDLVEYVRKGSRVTLGKLLPLAERVGAECKQQGLTQDQVADKVGCARWKISYLLQLLRLPEPTKKALEDGNVAAAKMSLSKALSMIRKAAQDPTP